MSEIILPNNFQAKTYRGFIVRIEKMKGLDTFYGLAVTEKYNFRYVGKTEREVGSKLHEFIDALRGGSTAGIDQLKLYEDDIDG